MTNDRKEKLKNSLTGTRLMILKTEEEISRAMIKMIDELKPNERLNPITSMLSSFLGSLGKQISINLNNGRMRDNSVKREDFVNFFRLGIYDEDIDRKDYTFHNGKTWRNKK